MRGTIRAVLMVLFAAVFMGGAAGVAAQTATEVSTPANADVSYPVAIHEGTCDAPVLEPAWKLDDALLVGADEDDPNVIGTQPTQNVAMTSKAVDFSLDSLAGSDYVIAVHASADDYETIVACGQLAGTKVDGRLVFALSAVNDSGITGIAVLDDDESGFFDLGDEQTQTTVYVVLPEDVSAATPAA